ncbi:MAG: urea ABC transporter permease subunit UrtB [Planctomycetes bacterium]|nr:urea ABC transporter permease subunit UrtB [Planctomycetota bacterium]
MRLFHTYKSKNDLLTDLRMKLSIKIAVLLFIITTLFFVQTDYLVAASNEKVDDLVNTLSDYDKTVRESAVRELGNIGDPTALNALNDLWNEEMDDEVVFAIEIAVSKLQLLDIDKGVRINGVEGLGEKAGTRSAVDATVGEIEGDSLFKQLMVDDQEMMVIITLLEKVLAIEKEKKVKKAITQTINRYKLSDSDSNIRKEAAEFFGELADPDTVIFLGRALDKEQDEEVRAFIKDAMSKIEWNDQVAITLKQLFNGITISSQYLLIALGLAITFGVMGVINLAHGEFMMLGCYVALVSQSIFACFFQPVLGLYWALAIPLSFIFTAGLGYALERSVIRFLYKRPLDTLLATWGISLLLQQAIRNYFGANNIDVPSPSWLLGGVEVLVGLYLPYKRLYIIGFTVCIVIAIYWLFYRTRFGLKIRAVMQNREMADCLGISTQRVNALTFALGSGLAGVAGCNMSLLGSVGPTTGQNYIVDCFMVVVLGGVGKIVGTIAGAFGLGETNAILEFFTTANIGKALTFILVIIFLRFRPTGFSASKGREDVRLETH